MSPIWNRTAQFGTLAGVFAICYVAGYRQGQNIMNKAKEDVRAESYVNNWELQSSSCSNSERKALTNVFRIQDGHSQGAYLGLRIRFGRLDDHSIAVTTAQHRPRRKRKLAE